MQNVWSLEVFQTTIFVAEFSHHSNLERARKNSLRILTVPNRKMLNCGKVGLLTEASRQASKCNGSTRISQIQ
jgi:putative heme iron utilization protein